MSRRKPRPAPILVPHGVTQEQWTKRYGIEPFSHPCQECGRMLTTTIPFARGTLRGLMAPSCACGRCLSEADAAKLPPDQVVSRTPYGLVRDPKVGDLFDCGGSLLS